MAANRRDKTKNVVQLDEMWKVYIRSEDDSLKIWKYNWGFILEEYSCLKKKLDEKTASSEFLTGVTEERKDDKRKLGTVPLTTNHFYGWVVKEQEFALEKYGPDFFKPLPLPSTYNVTKWLYK